MRYVNLLLIIAILALSGVAWSKIRQRNELPDVTVIGGEVYDAGLVSDKQPVVHTFKVVNPHPFDVTLSTPSPGCTCTTVSASSPVIPAKGSADVTLHIDAEDGNLAGSASFVTTHGSRRSETWLIVNGKVSHARRNTQLYDVPPFASKNATNSL